MGSELVRGFETGVARGLRAEACVDGGLRGVGAGEAMVSPSKPPSRSNRVVPASEPAASPQDEQNFALGEPFAPHVEQYMRGGILALVRGTPRTHVNHVTKCVPPAQQCHRRALP